MNLHRINRNAINTGTPFQPIKLYLYAGQTFNMGDDTPIYEEPIDTEANMQLIDNQKLQHIQGINLTAIHKRFFINSTITGLNRNLQTGGDYITWVEPNSGKTLKYKIIDVKNQFNVGYTEVICEESIVSE